MPKLRSPYPERRVVPWLGREIDPDEVVDVPDRDVPSYLAAGWKPVDDPKPKAAAAAAKTEKEN